MTDSRSLAADIYISDSSPVTLWYQLRHAMLSKIISGSWPEGQQLPIETELCETLRISRSTARAAIDSLARDGLVVRVKGKGTFVARMPTGDIRLSPLGFYRTMSASGYVVTSRVLDLRVVPASKELIDGLNLNADDQVLAIWRVRCLNGLPAALSKNYVVHNLCRGLEQEDLSGGSLWARLERGLHTKIVGGIHSFSAALPTEQEQQLLEVPAATPLLVSTGVNYLQDGTPFEWSEVKVLGQRSTVVVRFGYLGPAWGNGRQPDTMAANG